MKRDANDVLREHGADALREAFDTTPRQQPTTDRLHMLDVAAWHGMPVPVRGWAVTNRIALGNVTLMSGEGGVGKSILILQLCAAHVLGRDWFGSMPEQGTVIYLNAEDDERELHFRLAAIVAHLGTTFAALQGLHLVPLAGKDALLGVADRAGIIKPTPLFERLLRTATEMKPVLIALDTAADMFGGNENDRSQVRQFIGQLRGLAIAANAGVLLASHPSLSGINNDSGLSGSTGWHNSVRSRLYFKAADTDSEKPNSDLRELVIRKNNYGPRGEVIRMTWQNGVFVPVAAPSTIERAAAEQKVEQVFLDLLRRFTREGRNVSDKRGTTFAPAMFAEEAEAADVSKADLDDAMKRLFAANRIRVVSEGPRSRIRTRIIEVEREAFHQPSTSVPPDLPPLPPNTPCGGGRGQEGFEAPPPSTASRAASEGGHYRVVGPAPGATCVCCKVADDGVMKIKPATVGAKTEPLHERCAVGRFK